MEKVDARVRKTKNALKNALITLLGEKSYSDISVNELCQLAGIRRATFYKHYAGKDEFVYSVIKMLRDSYESKHWKDINPENLIEYLKSYAAALVSFFYRRREMCEKIISDYSCAKIIGIMVYQNYLDTEELLKSLVPPISSTNQVAGMLSGGIAMILIRWVKDGWSTPKEEIVNAIITMIDQLIKQD